MPDQTAPLFDGGNQFLGPDYPGLLTTGRLQTPGGERLCLTVRCGPATVTVTMGRDDAKQWAAQINAEADRLTGLIIPNGQVRVPEHPTERSG